jgi:hypothetical protein
MIEFEFELVLWLIPVFITGALLYATVGHGCLGAEIGSRRIQPASIYKKRALAQTSAGSKLAFI